MTDIKAVNPKKSWLPDTSHGLWRLCLLASLMINVIILGILLGHHYRSNPMDRPGAANYMQFVPQRFFAELPRERRRELGLAFRASKVDLEKARLLSVGNAEKVAAELVKPDFDASHIAALIDSFTTGPESVAAKGGTVLKDFYAKLSPDERALLAKAIEDRSQRQK